MKKKIGKDNITLIFKLYDNVSSKKDRIALEKKLIDTKKPIMQSGIKDRVKPIEDMIDELTNFLNEWNFPFVWLINNLIKCLQAL